MRRFRIVLLAAVGLAFGRILAGDVEPSDADWKWLDGASQVIDSIMPPTVDSHGLVAFRSQPGLDYYNPEDDRYDVPERYFEIREVLPEGITPWILVARLIEPQGRPLKTQLFTLHFKNPDASPNALAPKLTVRRAEITEE